MFIALGVIGLMVLIILFNMFHIMREYERAVVFTLGRFWKVKGPGLIIIVPFVQQLVKIELRTVVMDIPLLFESKLQSFRREDFFACGSPLQQHLKEAFHSSYSQQNREAREDL